MSFRVKNKQLLKNYNKKWGKVENLLKVNFECKPVYGDKYIKTKIKIYADSMITNFDDKKMPKEKEPCKCLLIIMLDPVIKTNKEYYLQTFLEEHKYTQETKNCIDDDFKESESDSDSNGETESDIDNDNDNDE